MKTETLNMLRHALNGNEQGVRSYAALLADNSEKAGDSKFAQRIRALLKGEEPGESNVCLGGGDGLLQPME